MKPKTPLLLPALLPAILLTMAMTGPIEEAHGARRSYRQYYSSWSYYPQRTYYYRSYYYKPVTTYKTYRYHYCIHYPSQPRYVYYFNPYRQVYWGRYDLETRGYSMLAAKDRKKNLDDIPDSAFPEPGKMPAVPESEDGVTIQPITSDDLPSSQPPQDIPGSE